MKEKEYLSVIEDMNLEYIKLKNSKEYRLGENLTKAYNMIKRRQVIQLIKKLHSNKIINKYNAHGNLENNYNYKVKNQAMKKIVIYSCITKEYDEPQEPIAKPSNVSYILFSDSEFKTNDWRIEKIPNEIKKLQDPILINRYIKFHPHELFENQYDYSIYIDGNIKVYGDLTDVTCGINETTGLGLHRHQFRNSIENEIEVCKIIGKGNYKKMHSQVAKYFEEGFPKDFGLFECNMIVCDLKNANSKKILQNWWDEFQCSESYRDQIALPYVLWKLGYKMNDVGDLGKNIYMNPKVRIIKHK